MYLLISGDKFLSAQKKSPEFTTESQVPCSLSHFSSVFFELKNHSSSQTPHYQCFQTSNICPVQPFAPIIQTIVLENRNWLLHRSNSEPSVFSYHIKCCSNRRSATYPSVTTFGNWSILNLQWHMTVEGYCSLGEVCTGITQKFESWWHITISPNPIFFSPYLSNDIMVTTVQSSLDYWVFKKLFVFSSKDTKAIRNFFQRFQLYLNKKQQNSRGVFNEIQKKHSRALNRPQQHKQTFQTRSMVLYSMLSLDFFFQYEGWFVWEMLTNFLESYHGRLSIVFLE